MSELAIKGSQLGISPFYIGRIVQGSEAVVTDLLAGDMENILIAQDCLVVPLVGPEQLHNVASGDSQAQRLVNILSRNGHAIPIDCTLQNSYLAPTSEVNTSTFNVRANIASPYKDVMWKESDLVNVSLRRWYNTRHVLDLTVRAMYSPAPVAMAHCIADVIKKHIGTPVTLTEPQVLRNRLPL